MRISVIHHNHKRIDHRLTDTVLAILQRLQMDVSWVANLKDDVTFHYTGCPANAFGAYRHDADGHHIYLRPRKRHPQGLAFTIAHELRHAWQYESGRLSTMGGYPWAWDGQEPCDGSENDPAERDADAAARAWIQAAW